METKNPTDSLQSSETIKPAASSLANERPAPSLVPKSITIGLAIFALVLSLAGYGFRLMMGEDSGAVLRHAAVIVPSFMIGIPLFFWLGSRLLNKVQGLRIQTRNALTLGWLTACVSMLWLMNG